MSLALCLSFSLQCMYSSQHISISEFHRVQMTWWYSKPLLTDRIQKGYGCVHIVTLCNNVKSYSKYLLFNLEPNYHQLFVCIFLSSWDLAVIIKKAIAEGKQVHSESSLHTVFRSLQGPIIPIHLKVITQKRSMYVHYIFLIQFHYNRNPAAFFLFHQSCAESTQHSGWNYRRQEYMSSSFL